MTPKPELYYALESLPALLGAGELATLRFAIVSALARNNPDALHKVEDEGEGERLARLIRAAAEPVERGGA